MQPNFRFKKFREDRTLTQLELSKHLGISRSLIADIERGSTGISKRVMSKLVKKFDIESGYFDAPVKEKNNEVNQGNESGYNQGNERFSQDKKKKSRRKWSYVYKFRQYIKDNYSDLDEIGNDLMILHFMSELLPELEPTKLGSALFFAIDNLESINTFKELKTIGLEAYRDALPYKEIIHQYAEASRIFIKQLNEIKDEIGLDYNLEDNL